MAIIGSLMTFPDKGVGVRRSTEIGAAENNRAAVGACNVGR